MNVNTRRTLLCIDADDTMLNTRWQFIQAAIEENPDVDVEELWNWHTLPLPEHALSPTIQNGMLSSGEFMATTKPLPGAYLALLALSEHYDIAIVTHRGYHPKGQERTVQCMRANFGPLMDSGFIKVYAIPTSVDKHSFCHSLCLPNDSTGVPAYDTYKLIDDNIPWNKYGDRATYGTLTFQGSELRKYISRRSIVIDQPWNQHEGFQGMPRAHSLLHVADCLCPYITSKLAADEIGRLLHPNVPEETNEFRLFADRACARSKKTGNSMLAIPSTGPTYVAHVLQRVPRVYDVHEPATQWRTTDV